jgi:hypothetical protein
MLYAVCGVFGYLRFGGETPDNILLAYSNLPDGSTQQRLFIGARIGMVACLIFSMPLVLYPFRMCAHQLLKVAVLSRQSGSGDGGAQPAGVGRAPGGARPRGNSVSAVGETAKQPLLGAASGSSSTAAQADPTASPAATAESGLGCCGRCLASLSPDTVFNAETFLLLSLCLLLSAVVPNILVAFGLTGAVGGCTLVYVLPPLFYLKLSNKEGCLSSCTHLWAVILLLVGAAISVICTVAIVVSLVQPAEQ